MAVGGPGCRRRERRRGAVSCCATDGLFIFSQLGWLLSSTDTPAPLPQEEREGPRGPGESPLPQREGGAAPRYHLCSGAGAEPRLRGAGCRLLPPGALLTWNGMIRAPTATPHPVAGLVSSHPAPMAAINGALFCGIWPRHLSQAKAPGPRAVQVVREGGLGNGLGRGCPGLLQSHPPGPRPHRLLAGPGWGARGSLFSCHTFGRCSAGWRPRGHKDNKGLSAQRGAGALEKMEGPGHLRQRPKAGRDEWNKALGGLKRNRGLRPPPETPSPLRRSRAPQKAPATLQGAGGGSRTPPFLIGHKYRSRKYVLNKGPKRPVGHPNVLIFPALKEPGA